MKFILSSFLTCFSFLLSSQTNAELLAAAGSFPPMPRETIDLVPYVNGLPTFGSGTPFNDLEYTVMNFDYIDGENGGGDVFMPFNPSEQFPGSNTVKLIKCTLNTDLNEAYDTADADRIILGTDEIPYPFFSKGTDGLDNDYVVIKHFDYDFGKIQLRGSHTDYRLLYATLSEGVATEGYYLFYTEDNEIDLIAFIFPCDDLSAPVSGNPPQNTTSLCNASQTLSLTNTNQFVYATAISETPNIMEGLFQTGSSGKDIVGGLTVDSDGFVYLMGSTDGSFPNSTVSGHKIFISKNTPGGGQEWLVEIPLPNGSLLFDAVADDNYLYACGRTLGSLPGFSSAGRWDGILLKVDKMTGNVVDTDQWGNSGIDGYGNIVLDNEGNLYVSGQGSPDGDGGTDDLYLVAKHSTSNLQNVWRELNPVNATGFTASAEAWGGLTLVFNTMGIAERLVAAGWYITAGGANAFVSVYENLQSTTPTRPHSIVFNSPGPQADWVLDNAVDSSGNIYVAGFTSGSLNGSHLGEGDAYITKFDAQLQNPITVQFGTSKSDMIRKLDIDDNDNLYAVGYTYGNYQGQNQDANLSTGDVLVQKFDSDLTLLDNLQFGTSNEDRSYSYLLNEVLYIGGSTEGSLAGTTNGSFDAYVVALNTTDLSFANPNLGLDELVPTSQLTLYPNPVRSSINVKIEVLDTLKYRIIDINGREIFGGTLEMGQAEIDISHLKTGTYLFSYENSQLTGVEKLIKL